MNLRDLIHEALARAVSWVALTGLVALQSGCLVGPAYGVYDTNQCYWTWVQDGAGGYEQMYCWNPGVGTYREYMYGGSYVRRYPAWYSGSRVVVTPPHYGIVQPRGVVVVPPPMRPPQGMMPARPSPGGAVPWAVPSTR